MSHPRLVIAGLLSVFVAGVVFGHVSAQVPASVALHIFPKRYGTEARLQTYTTEYPSRWYYKVEYRTKPSGGSWGSYQQLGPLVYILPADFVGCHLDYVKVLTLPSPTHTAQFRPTQYESASTYASVYDCASTPTEMLYANTSDEFISDELASGQSAAAVYLYDNTTH